MLDFQVSFNGLTMGPGTPYQMNHMAGFDDLAGARQNFVSRARSHGAFVEPRYLDGALYDLEFDITAFGAVSFPQAVQNLAAAMVPMQGTSPLVYQLPGHPQLTVNAQVLRRSVPIWLGYEFGIAAQAALQFYTPDPRKYGVVKATATNLPSSTGGLIYPLTYPLTYGVSSSGNATVTNLGSADASPVFTVAGLLDANGFQVTNLEDGVTITYTGSLGTSDRLVVNTATGSVVLNGQSDRRSLLAAPAWPVIPAQTTRTFRFTTAGAYSASASLSVASSDTYW